MVRFFVLGALILGLAGCVSAPPARSPGEAASWLGGTPSALVRIDPTQVKAWGQVTGSRPDLKEVGARTRMVWVGLDPESLGDLDGAAARAHLVLEGDFPKTAATLMLSFSSDWVQEPAAGVWTNPKQELSVCIPEEGLVSVRRRDPSVPHPSAGVLRDLTAADWGTNAVWVTLWNPSQVLFGEAGAKLLRISRLDLALAARGENLEGPVALRFADERSARGALVLLKLFTKQIQTRTGQI